ncbi:MAG TPA: hypothetical protein VMV10_29030 [Pirellulales bacterium]|nr:hypothetical protein [Pirellulales bacterium]
MPRHLDCGRLTTLVCCGLAMLFAPPLGAPLFAQQAVSSPAAASETERKAAPDSALVSVEKLVESVRKSIVVITFSGRGGVGPKAPTHGLKRQRRAVAAARRFRRAAALART